MRRALYSYLMNVETCTPISEVKSRQLFIDAEARLGTPEWQEHAQQSGVKCMAVAEAGASHHNLAPDPTQNAWSRIDMGSMHFLGIVDCNFRELLLSFAPADARRRISASPFVLRQPPGTKKLNSYVTVSKADNSAKFSAADEKLHQKQKWRKTLMLYDLKPLFKENSERNNDISLVRCKICLLVYSFN